MPKIQFDNERRKQNKNNLCVQGSQQLCECVGNSSALLWLVDVAAPAPRTKNTGKCSKGGAYAVRVPPHTLPKAAQSRRRPQSRSRLPNPTPDCGHLEASATHQRSAANAGSAVIAEAAAAETTSQPLCALLDHSPSAVARVRYRAILTPT